MRKYFDNSLVDKINKPQSLPQSKPSDLIYKLEFNEWEVKSDVSVLVFVGLMFMIDVHLILKEFIHEEEQK